MGKVKALGLGAGLGAVLLASCAATSGAEPSPGAVPSGGRTAIVWSTGRPLAWSDFAGPVPQDRANASIRYRFAALIGANVVDSAHEAAETVSSIGHAASHYSYTCITTSTTRCSVTGVTADAAAAEFDPNRSWAIAGEESDRLLEHEQGHFDIAAIYAARLTARLAAELKSQTAGMCVVAQDQSSAEADLKRRMDELQQAVSQAVGQEFEDTQTQYDADTNHGLNPSGQKQWSDRIREELRGLYPTLQARTAPIPAPHGSSAGGVVRA